MGTASRDQVSSSTEPNPELEDTDPWADADILGSPEDESVDESVGSSKRRKVTDIRGAQNDDVLKLALSADITSDAQSIVARGRITRFAQPRYRMFETRDIYTSSSDYGRSIEDFRFRDISSSTFRFICRPSSVIFYPSNVYSIGITCREDPTKTIVSPQPAPILMLITTLRLIISFLKLFMINWILALTTLL